MKNNTQDLTNGNIFSTLIKFGLPLLFANLLQSFYSIVDMLIIGRFQGNIGLAAISNASTVCFIMNSICIGITMGGSVLISQYKGANDKKGQHDTIGNLFLISAIFAILITLIGLITCNSLFTFLDIPQEAMKDTCDYMNIMYIGSIGVFGYNAVSSIMRGLGNSKDPLYYVAIATVINTILDIILVGPAHMGTKGAALATIIAQAVSFIIAINRLKNNYSIFDFKIRTFNIKMAEIKKILKIGMPTAIQMVVVNVAYLLVNKMLNIYGINVIAGYGIGLKINTFTGMPCWAIGQAITTIVGQNMGAKKTQRVSEVVKKGILLNLLVTSAAVILVQIFANQLISIFNNNSEVIYAGVTYLRICCFINGLIYAAMYTLDSFLTGVGMSTLAMFNALLDSVIVRIIFSWILGTVLAKGFIGVYIAQAISPILPMCIGLIYFISGRWKNKVLIE